jgi:hypothetical protein
MTDTLQLSLDLGPCQEQLQEHDDGSFDVLITDPPYGLGDNPPDVDELLRAWASGQSYDMGSGFMSEKWDQLPSPKVFEEVLRVLKPGAKGAVFAGTRTWDLMQVSLKIAGFEVIDCWRWQYGCLTEDTEILTENGWKQGTNVEEGESVLTWDPSNENLNLDSVQKTFEEHYEGSMIEISNDDTSQLLTPNHRVYHKQLKRKQENYEREIWYNDTWEVSEAHEIDDYSTMKFPLAGYHDGKGIGGTEFAKLLAWVWTEGGFDNSGTGVRIYQSKTASPECVKSIETVLENVVEDYSRYERDRTYENSDGETQQYVEISWYFSGDIAEKVRSYLPGKSPDWEVLWNMTQAEKQVFNEVARKGDGHGYDFYQSDKEDLTWYQALLTTIGERGKIQMRQDRPRGSVCWTPRKSTELQSQHFKNSRQKYTGKVWCVKVPSGAFVARRNGKVFITGNSGFPKSFNVRKHILKKVDSRYGSKDVRCECSEDAEWDGNGTPDPDREENRKIIPDDYDDHDLVTRVCSWCLKPDSEFISELDGKGTALKPSYEPIIIVRKPEEPRHDQEEILRRYGIDV